MGLASCGCEETSAPIPPANRPPEITSFAPLDDQQLVHVGERIDFAVEARDPESRELDFGFLVDGVTVVKGRNFSFLPESPGMRRVSARVFDGRNEATHEWLVLVTALPDTIAPAPVEIVRFDATDDPGVAELEWIAVGGDSLSGSVERYLVRTSLSPMTTESDWALAERYADVVSTEPSGGTIHVVLTGLTAGRTVAVCVRAVDYAGNMSPMSACPQVLVHGFDLTGRVIDALTGDGIAGARVEFGSRVVVADASGHYEFPDLPATSATLHVLGEQQPGVGAYFDYVLPYGVDRDIVADVFLLPNVALQTTMYSDFLEFFRSMTDIAGNPFGAETRRRDLPIALYISSFTKDGLDYRATIVAVAAEFDALLGQPVFTIVDEVPTTGVEIVYDNQVVRDNYWVKTWTPDWYPEHGIIQFRTAYTPASHGALEVVARHEFGHVLGLNHSVDSMHIMQGGSAPIVQRFSADEIAVIRCLFGLPHGWDNRLFDHD